MFSQKSLQSSLLRTKNNPILHSQVILYFILFVCLGDLFLLSAERDYTSISIFVILAFLTSFFTKNMMIVLFLSLTMTNVIKYGANVTHESFKTSKEDEDVSKKGEEDNMSVKSQEEGEESDEEEEEESKKEPYENGDKKDSKKEAKKSDKKDKKKDSKKEPYENGDKKDAINTKDLGVKMKKIIQAFQS